MNIYDTQIKNYAAEKNEMRGASGREQNVRRFPELSLEDFLNRIPAVFWEGHPEYEELYRKAWELAFEHIKSPTRENGFLSSYIDTAFNDCTFLWDSIFITQFAKYGRNCFDFMGMMDNFYGKQHDDGFICREIGSVLGEDRFQKFDPVSTGPNLFAYCEWEHYRQFGDKERLKRVFPALVGYYRWFRLYRSWPDGSYWNSGWGCGLDNSPRFEKGEILAHFDDSMGFDFYHGFHTWLDACTHQVLSGKLLLQMAELLGCAEELKDIREETGFLQRYIDEKLWDEKSGFYYDRDRTGKLTGVKTILAYWTLLAEIPDEKRAQRLVAHLEDPAEFHAKHLLPSLSMDHPCFGDDPIYWQGGVWAPTNYMVLQGLYRYGYQGLAHEIACNTLRAVEKVYRDTGTLWEYYHPMKMQKGAVARPDFVGWTDLIPVSVLIEYVFGIHTDAEKREVRWDISLPEKHGVTRLPVFDHGTISLMFSGETPAGEPSVKAESDVPLLLTVCYKGQEYKHHLNGSAVRNAGRG